MSTEADDRRRIKVFQSLFRPQLMAGGERSLVLAVFFLAIITVVGGKLVSPTAWALAVLIVAIGLPIVRAMAKADPKMFEIYLRAKDYRQFYQARANVAAPHKKVH